MNNTKCNCVSKHVPLPTNTIPITIGEEKIHLCPTTHSNLMDYITKWIELGHIPPGNVRKHYSDFVQALANRIQV